MFHMAFVATDATVWSLSGPMMRGTMLFYCLDRLALQDLSSYKDLA